MSLTGTSFLVFVVLATAVLFVLLVVLWPWFAGASLGQVTGRVSMLVVMNLMVLLTAGVMLNDTYLFYASWGDLHGALTGGPVSMTRLDRGAPGTVATETQLAARRFDPGAPADTATRVPTLDNFTVPGYRLVTYRVHGRASGITNTVVVELPPGYGAPANHRRYPVIADAFYRAAPRG